ncbi:AraC family transcriptional regulator [Niveibacterium terrae]|uniref:helix-turn-helix transcriptional regulator n=1 Tax=Niveibacterium terrae TaxID=3373598 RepID=UPI003A92DBEE
MNAPSSQTRFWRPLPWLEIRQSHEMRERFVRHTHPGLSIGLIDRGATVLDLGGRRVPLVAGQAVLIPPGLAHACNPEPSQPWSNRMVFVAAGANWALPEGGQAIVLRDRARCLKLRALITRLCRPHAKWIDAFALMRALKSLAGERGRIRSRPAWLAPIKHGLLAGNGETLATLAQRVGLSRWQLIRAFAAATGLTPHAWLLDQRVQRARELLREPGRSLSEIALTTGFADQSHFSRAFKARTAVTPGRYRGKP